MSDISRKLFKSIVTDTASQEAFSSAVKEKLDQAIEVRRAGIAGEIYNKGASLETSKEVVNEASKNDVEKLIKHFVGMGHGHKRKGNSVDFGGGSVIEFSFDKGKIKFDGGKSAGKGYFDNLKDAIASLSLGMED
tara:strand:+ start:132 stop:536 length:405 start_codon:yes stop_codon:yes gene_type:complete